MKLYLAYKDSNTLMEGYYEHCIGVFNTEELAWKALKKTRDFKDSEPTKDGKDRVYHFDGELSVYWRVREVTLNRKFDDAF